MSDENAEEAVVPVASSQMLDIKAPTDVENESSLLMLNNDCLEHIIDKLDDLASELAVSRVCKRLQTICIMKWRYSHAYDELNLDRWRELLPNQCDLQHFLNLMRPYIRSIFVNSCVCTMLRDLKEMGIHVLPLVINFYHDIEGDIGCYPSDRNIRQMASMLPNLRRLHLTTPIHGRYLANFRYLQELHLYEDHRKDYELKQQYLDEVCTKLTHLQLLDIRLYEDLSKLRLNNCFEAPALQNLTTLKLNLATLKSVLNQVLALPALKQLVVLLDSEWRTEDILNVDTYDHKIRDVDEFYEIMKRMAQSIVGFAVDGYYMPLEPGWDDALPIWSLRKLERLAICSWRHSEHLLEPYLCMSNLTLLCLRNCTLLSDALLLQFIEKCPLLQHLDVSYCRKLTANCLPRALDIKKQRRSTYFRRQYDSTQIALRIYYVLSGFEEHVELNILRISHEYKDFIIFMEQFPNGSERGLSFVDRGYQFDFE